MIREGLGFDDVLLLPRKSDALSRKGVDISSYLTREIKLFTPIISANMTNVTESRLAIAMAREGGIGVIHRFMSIKEEAAEVRKVKRIESIIIEDPYTITKEKSIEEAKEMMEGYGVNGLLVQEDGKLIGVLTARDTLFEDEKNKVADAMSDKDEMVYARYGISVEEAEAVLKKNKVEKLPLVDSEMRIKALITTRDLKMAKDFPHATKDKRGRLVVGAAVGVKEGFLERARELVDAGCDIIIVDIAHGHSDLAINAVKALKDEFKDTPVAAGNVATKEGMADLIKAGADAIKIGIGSGSICITRNVTGVGVPQITAILDCAEVAKKEGVPIISDGGVKNSGDIMKALAAGASGVMIGSLFAGSEESPGIVIMRNGKKQKFYKGMASAQANIERGTREFNIREDELIDYVPEGVEAIVPYRGTVHEVMTQLAGGVRAGLSYCGSRNIRELWETAEIIKVGSGLKEGLPEGIGFY